MRNTHNEPQEGDHTESQKHPNWLIQFRRKYVDGKVATWTLLFTAALVFFTAKLWQVSNRQNEIAVSSQRGFLTFVGPNPSARLIDNAGAWIGNEIALNWINSGNTAARNVVIQNNGSPFFPDVPEGYSFPLIPPKTKVVIGPKQTYGVNAQMGKDLVMDYFNHKKLSLCGEPPYTAIHLKGLPNG